MPSWIAETFAWWTSLPPEWRFLFCLPFAVAAAALVNPWRRE